MNYLLGAKTIFAALSVLVSLFPEAAKLFA
jgi:hypothetical protein